MKISFEGQVVVVTGAAGRLGRTYSLEFARRGAAVVVNDVVNDESGESGADKVVAEIQAGGGKAVAAGDSVGTAEGAAAIIETALQHFGSVDAVIHNAGTWRHVPFEEMTPDKLDPVLDVHLRGAFFLCQPAWCVMKEKGYGRIVLTSSSAGLFGREWGANYAASKAGLFGLGNALALEGERLGIRTNCLLPIAAPTTTARAVPPPPPAMLEQMQRSGLKDIFPPYPTTAQVAPLVTWLASSACTVNGEAFSAGCGRYARTFVGLVPGWLTPGAEPPTAEDVGDHLDEIQDQNGYTVPGAIWDELRWIGEMIAERDGLDDLFED